MAKPNSTVVRLPTALDDHRAGPVGPLFAEIVGMEEQLQDLLAGFPLGSTDDPGAEASPATLADLVEARELLEKVNDLIERSSERECLYSVDNGYSLPD